MAWDDVKVDGTSTLPAAEWNTHVTDQKTRQTAAQVNTLISAFFGLLFCNSDTYVGDSTANRAIPHGLGRIPKIVIAIESVDGSGLNYILMGAQVVGMGGGAGSRLVVTAADGTNFYVGNAANYTYSANLTGKTYTWFAI